MIHMGMDSSASLNPAQLSKCGAQYTSSSCQILRAGQLSQQTPTAQGAGPTRSPALSSFLPRPGAQSHLVELVAAVQGQEGLWVSSPDLRMRLDSGYLCPLNRSLLPVVCQH